MSDTFCQACKCFTEVVFDHAAGDTLCSECGTVLVDETPEWLSVPDQTDPTRVSKPVSPVQPDSGDSRPNGASDEEALPPRAKWRKKPRRQPFDVSGSIADVADRLGLVATIQDRANEIYKKVVDQKPLRWRTRDAVVAACLYIACRQENKPRTVKEMCSAIGTTKKEVAKAKDFIGKYVETEMGQEIGTIHAGDYLRRFCSILGMSNLEVVAAQETVQKSEELVLRRSPISVAASVMYIITQLSTNKKTAKEIAFVTRVAEATIKNSYKDLYPHLSELIPTWFAKEEDLKKLPSA